jgi:adenosylhomocysteine nucleosidase
MTLRGTITPDRPLLAVALEEEAQHFPQDLPILFLGVGKVNAAVRMAETLATARPSEVINIGTAGGLISGVDGIHEIGTVIQHDLNDDVLFALVQRYFGEPIVLGDGPTLATGDTFVTDSEVRRELATRAQLVDMEAYSVVVAAQRAGVPVRLIKLVSDEANEESVKTWAQTVEEHSRTLGAWIADNLL